MTSGCRDRRHVQCRICRSKVGGSSFHEICSQQLCRCNSHYLGITESHLFIMQLSRPTKALSSLEARPARVPPSKMWSFSILPTALLNGQQTSTHSFQRTGQLPVPCMILKAKQSMFSVCAIRSVYRARIAGMQEAMMKLAQSWPADGSWISTSKMVAG